MTNMTTNNQVTVIEKALKSEQQPFQNNAKCDHGGQARENFVPSHVTSHPNITTRRGGTDRGMMLL